MLQLFDLILTRYKDLHIFIDILFVNDNTFLHTKSKNINYQFVQSLKTKRSTEAAKGLTIVKRKYEKRGFRVNKWQADTEFNNLIIFDAIEPASLEVYANKEHAGFIERTIHEIKEWA